MAAPLWWRRRRMATDSEGPGRYLSRGASLAAATRAVAAVAHATISQVDPRGLATFGIVGLVVFAFSRHVRQRSRFVGLLGQILGVDMVLLFASSAFAATVPILITGGLASVILGPAWWLSVARLLHRERLMAR